jgi:hypothetical protein
VLFGAFLSTNPDRSCCLVLSCPGTYGYTNGYRPSSLVPETPTGIAVPRVGDWIDSASGDHALALCCGVGVAA